MNSDRVWKVFEFLRRWLLMWVVRAQVDIIYYPVTDMLILSNSAV